MANPLTRDLAALCRFFETDVDLGPYAQAFHLAPPVGWLNDPNGLCQLGDAFHAFFQYSPFNPEGGIKLWGHSTSRDLLHWDYRGAVLFPDQPVDVGGVYSGSACVVDGEMHVFYTGNVKLEDRDDYDYVTRGREANVVHVVSKDGSRFGPKRCVLRNEDYPADVTCHVRDPKVFPLGDSYVMVLGSRRVDDQGEVLVYRSRDLDRWGLVNRISSAEPFGYMWECPDYFELNDKNGDGLSLLSVSPQGLAGGDWDCRNVYQSGYFPLEGDLCDACSLGSFALWDAGFDFYAPQSFETSDGRRVLIGWMGMPDDDTYTNLTLADGWQHCFTLPRELVFQEGRVLQKPVREVDELRREGRQAKEHLSARGLSCFDLVIDAESSLESMQVRLAEELLISWDGNRFELHFLDDSKDSVGAGRRSRFEPFDELHTVRIIGDTSSIEVFVNDGELTFSTRYYPKSYEIEADAPAADVSLWELRAG